MPEDAAPAPRRPPGRPAGGSAPVAPNGDLLPVALEAFADLGYEGASMRDLCRRLGQVAAAAASYRRALELTRQEPERRFIERRLRELGATGGS